MLIFVFICKGIEEKGAIWANIGRILSDFSRIFPGMGGDFWRDFGAEMEFGGEIWGPGAAG